MMQQQSLWQEERQTGELITVHCFFGCPYVAQSVEPQPTHDLMERHYTEKHAKQIDRIIARWK